MEKSKRKQEIMLLNTLLFLIVVFIHVSSHPISSYAKPSLPYTLVFVPWRLSAFVVQGFIFLSALKFFLKPMENFSYKGFMLKRIKTIYAPYLLAVLVYYLYFIHRGYFPFRIKDLVFYVLSGSIVSPFYFIVIIMQFYLLMPLWIKMTEKIKPLTALALSLAVMLICKYYIPQLLAGFEKISGYNDRIFTTYLIYWTAGCYAGINYKKICAAAERLLPIFMALFAITASGDIYFSYQSFVYGKYFAFLENLHMLYCIAVLLFLFALCLRLKNAKAPFLKTLDSVSYNVFLVHCLVIFVVNDYMARFGIISVTKQFVIRFVLAYGVSFALCIGYKKIKKTLHKKF